MHEGEELKLTCHAVGHPIPNQIEWFVNGSRVGRERDNLSIRSFATPSDHALTSQLTIYPSQKADSAIYYCRSTPSNDVMRKHVDVVMRRYGKCLKRKFFPGTRG